MSVEDMRDIGWKIQCDESLTESQKDIISRYAQVCMLEARAEIVAKLRAKNDANGFTNDEFSFAVIQNVADWIEAGCPL